MISSVCTGCQRLTYGKCKGLQKNTPYTGCAQKVGLTFYGEQLLKSFKDRCINVVGRDYFDKVCDSDNGTTMLNIVVNSDELLAGWFLFTYEDIPLEIFTYLDQWSEGDYGSLISVMRYSEGAAGENIPSWTTRLYELINILKKAIMPYNKED